MENAPARFRTAYRRPSTGATAAAPASAMATTPASATATTRGSATTTQSPGTEEGDSDDVYSESEYLAKFQHDLTNSAAKVKLEDGVDLWDWE